VAITQERAYRNSSNEASSTVIFPDMGYLLGGVVCATQPEGCPPVLTDWQ
jgi:hypothetical protein